MNIKSLLLGSAAAAVAFTGAQAADAIIIAEPEPLEYVRICDAYGAGYFYIPGTETCLRISGWVRYQIDATPSRDARVTITARDSTGAPITTPPFPIELSDRATYGLTSLDPDTGFLARSGRSTGWSKYTGAQINLDARSETEYGTLRGWVQLETPTGAFSPVGGTNRDHPSGDIGIAVNRAAIQLGGLWLAYTDSLFSSSSTIGGSSLGNYGGFTYADTFGYHYEQRHQIGYQFSGANGFWGGISLEHDDAGNYAPDVVGKIAYSQGWGGAWLAVAYDESADGFGVRGGVQARFDPLTVRLDGYYQSNAEVAYGRDAKWAIQGTALYQINPQLGIAGGLEYRKDLALLRTAYLPNSSAWAAQAGVNWQPVQNFLIGADVTYNSQKASASFVTGGGNTINVAAKQDWTSFRVRFQRNF